MTRSRLRPAAATCEKPTFDNLAPKRIPCVRGGLRRQRHAAKLTPSQGGKGLNILSRCESASAYAPRCQPPRVLPHQFPRPVERLVADVEHLGEVLAQVVGRGSLDALPGSRNESLDRGNKAASSDTSTTQSLDCENRRLLWKMLEDAPPAKMAIDRRR